MNSKSQFKLKLIFLSSIIIFSISVFSSYRNKNNSDSLNIINLEALQLSPSQSLNHDDYAEIHSYADQYIDWSFSTAPSQVINVWALDSTQYLIFTSGFTAFGDLLSTSSSDSGRYNVPNGNYWYIIFWNDQTGSQNTVVSFNANFVGDSRPPTVSNKTITIIEPTYTTVLVPKTTHTILWEIIGSINEVTIELFRGDELLKVIASDTNNDGSHSWIPHYYTKNDYMWNVIPEGSDYRIKIREKPYPYTHKFSDYFSITNVKSLTVLEPNRSSVYTSGQTITINWITDTPSPSFIIEFFSVTPDTHTIENIITIPMAPNIGYYNLTLPMDLPYGNRYRISIDAPDNSIYEVSDFFTIGIMKNDSLSILSYQILPLIGILFLITCLSVYRRRKRLNLI